MANFQKLIDLDGLSYFLGQIKAKFVSSVNGAKPDYKGNVNIADMEGATLYRAGKAGLAPIPAAGKQDMALCGDATYKVLPIAGGGTGASDARGARSNLGLGTAITSASISGTEITLTKADGTIQTLTTQDTVAPTPEAYVTATYNYGTTWYRKYSDGFKICGLRASIYTRWTDVVLPLAFSNTNYTIIACDTNYNTVDISCQPGTTTQIQCVADETTLAHIIVQGY